MLEHLGSMGSLGPCCRAVQRAVRGHGVRGGHGALELRAHRRLGRYRGRGAVQRTGSCRTRAQRAAREGSLRGSPMVGAKVLFNSAKMLKMGVYVVFMHD